MPPGRLPGAPPPHGRACPCLASLHLWKLSVTSPLSGMKANPATQAFGRTQVTGDWRGESASAEVGHSRVRHWPRGREPRAWPGPPSASASSLRERECPIPAPTTPGHAAAPLSRALALTAGDTGSWWRPGTGRGRRGPRSARRAPVPLAGVVRLADACHRAGRTSCPARPRPRQRTAGGRRGRMGADVGTSRASLASSGRQRGPVLPMRTFARRGWGPCQPGIRKHTSG